MAQATSPTIETQISTRTDTDVDTDLNRIQLLQVSELLQRFHALDTQDSGIWSRNLLLLMVFCAGFLSFVYPQLVWGQRDLTFDSRYLPQFFFGLTTLVILYNAHILDQRKRLRYAREEMVRQLLRAEFRENQALIDPLTQVYNRRYLDKILRVETNRANRSNSSLVLMMADLDGFKAVNTRLGHLAGDQLLREVAELLSRVFRRSDTIIRYGGDEFLIVMPDTTEDQARNAGDRLQQEVASSLQQGPGGRYAVGISCGIATYRKDDDIEAVVRTADERMYEEKARHHAASATASQR